jgi:hypothetical protein
VTCLSAVDVTVYFAEDRPMPANGGTVSVPVSVQGSRADASVTGSTVGPGGAVDRAGADEGDRFGAGSGLGWHADPINSTSAAIPATISV